MSPIRREQQDRPEGFDSLFNGLTNSAQEAGIPLKSSTQAGLAPP
jgi:hypothetical protein